MMKRQRANALILSLLLFNSNVYSKDFTTAEISSDTLNMKCIDYCIVGVCFYMYCTPVGCDIDTQPRIRHYLPDLFVTVYDEPKENPWKEYRSLMGNAEVAAQEGLISKATSQEVTGGEIKSPPPKLPYIKFKEASVVGHPLATITKKNFTKYLCKSDATAFKPYFSSAFDYFAWRWGIPDNLTEASWVPGEREIGSRTVKKLWGNTWGAVFPRQGFIMQKDDAKAAAVIAQRAVDVVLKTGQPHIYSPFGSDKNNSDSQNNSNGSSGNSSGSSGDNKKPTITSQKGKSESGSGSNEKSDHWQMFRPKKESTCSPFGSSDPDWSAGREDKDHQYAWSYWRQYECCIPGTGFYVGTVDTPPICMN